MPAGTVTEFDDATGLGTITDTDGRSYLFHCIEIADGTRTIEVGRSVRFVALPRFGAVQAGHIDTI
jgi:cold shock CspA family protein